MKKSWRLTDRIRADHVARINGDCSGYEFSDETSTILGAFGGAGVGAAVGDLASRRAVQQFESGRVTWEVLNGGVSSGVAWLGADRAGVGEVPRTRPEPVRWDLRVTEVFERRDG